MWLPPFDRRHVLLQLLGIRTARNDSPIFLSMPPTLTRETLAFTTEQMFSLFNTPGLCIAEEPQVSAYAAGVLTATVVDFGWEQCTISPVFEQSGVMSHAVVRSDVGMRHVAIYLAYLLSRDESVVQALITLDARRNARVGTEGGDQGSGDQLAIRLFELAVHLIGQGKVKATLQGEGYATQVAREEEEEAEFDIAAALVAGREKAAIEEQERRNKAALEASDREANQGAAPTDQGQAMLLDGKGQVQAGASKEEGAEIVQFQGVTIKVGPGPLSQACEPLWDPSVLSNLRGRLAASCNTSLGPLDVGTGHVDTDYSILRSLPESIASCIKAAADPERRAQLWETILATGAPIRLIQNFSSVLVAACQSCLASSHGADQGSGPISALASGSGGISRDSPGIGGTMEDTSQPTVARCIKTPDYFAEYKDRTDMAPFLGATIYAKLAFTDPYGRLVTSKAVYNEKGPSATFLISAPS
jgi:actin-related protein 9